MSDDVDRSRFAHLPEPVPVAEVVESVDVRVLPESDSRDEREQVLRTTGFGVG